MKRFAAALSALAVLQILPFNVSATFFKAGDEFTECPEPPGTITTSDGRIYECRIEEGEDPYQDVTPPDDKTHWKSPLVLLSSITITKASTFHPPEDWPFRGFVAFGSPRALNPVFFYLFDRQGVIVDSNDPAAIGEQMMEVRISGMRLWPSARVYYRARPNPDQNVKTTLDNVSRISDTAYYALVVDGDKLCPVLDESSFAGPPNFENTAGLYINGRCGEVGGPSGGRERAPGTLYIYPGFTASGPRLVWDFLRHGEPERPLLGRRRGECMAFCESQPTPADPP